jgi:transposase
MVGGITLRTVYFRIFPGSIQSEQVVQFLRDLFRHLPGKVILIWDRLPVHRSRRVQGFLEKYERVRQEFLPAYAPELNPMEYVWCQLKTHELPNVCVDRLGELSCQTRRALGRIRRRPALIASCWKQSRLPI